MSEPVRKVEITKTISFNLSDMTIDKLRDFLADNYNFKTDYHYNFLLKRAYILDKESVLFSTDYEYIHIADIELKRWYISKIQDLEGEVDIEDIYPPAGIKENNKRSTLS